MLLAPLADRSPTPVPVQCLAFPPRALNVRRPNERADLRRDEHSEFLLCDSHRGAIPGTQRVDAAMVGARTREGSTRDLRGSHCRTEIGAGTKTNRWRGIARPAEPAGKLAGG